MGIYNYKVKYRGKIYEIKVEKDKLMIEEILKNLGLSREYAFVVKNGEIEMDGYIYPSDEIEVINAVSGG
ncbi:MAG: thiamine biosynthesis protein ThiS [Dictyoglomus sp. NZ13-RE01]|nr:MAG: thiamine biosynthesis protein ThiS [Dictyoglomus sp. NZ13-RE01]